MVIRVSPNCVNVTPTRFSSSSVIWLAMALARAVMDAVNSQGFTWASPPHHSMRVLRSPVPLFLSWQKENVLKAKPSGRLGGDKRDRTADAIQALSQLSYTPKYFASGRTTVPRTLIIIAIVGANVNPKIEIFSTFLCKRSDATFLVELTPGN